MLPEISDYYKSKQTSAIRIAQIEFTKRNDSVKAINTSIGNVSLPMHPAMQQRMFNLQNTNSPFSEGIVKYTSTIGNPETNKAFLNIIRSSGFDTKNLFSQITDGGSQAMILSLLAMKGENPILLIDPAYTNYKALANRLDQKIINITRKLDENGNFQLPNISEIQKTISKYKPKAIIIIPYDNPTGQFMNQNTIDQIAQLCIENNMRIISDEAYRELYYTNEKPSSVRGIDTKKFPDIQGRRISIETASKVWNACGLRIGALITDNKNLHTKAIAENTAALCANHIGQYIFGALAHESTKNLQKRYQQQRNYYFSMMQEFTQNIQKEIPNIIVSSPDAALYSVVDFKNIVDKNFDSMDFGLFCAKYGQVDIDGQKLTLLSSPMTGFYNTPEGQTLGKTQIRISFVETPEKMKLVPTLLKKLLEQYKKNR